MNAPSRGIRHHHRDHRPARVVALYVTVTFTAVWFLIAAFAPAPNGGAAHNTDVHGRGAPGSEHEAYRVSPLDPVLSANMRFVAEAAQNRAYMKARLSQEAMAAAMRTLSQATMAVAATTAAHPVITTPSPVLLPTRYFHLLGENSAPNTRAAPCLVAQCPRKDYTQFRHYELCENAQAALAMWNLNNTAMDFSAATRLKLASPFAEPRTQAELDSERACNGRTKTIEGDARRADLASCVDPRWPLRLPLTMHSIGSAGALACYARGDMVCDIVGRSGGWESELIALISMALIQARAAAVRRAAHWRETEFQALEKFFGVAAVQQAHNALANHSAWKAHLAAAGAKGFATELDELNDVFRYDEVYSRRIPGKPFATTPLPSDTGDDEANYTMTRDEEHQFRQGRGAFGYSHELLYSMRKLPVQHATRGAFGVEYIDIGANVGAFVMYMQRIGFPVLAFEALPHNMQLLSTTLCVNGLRKPSDGLDEPSIVRGELSVDGEPSVTIHHTALGREKDLRCVMMSEDLNFGDTWISCNATHVNSTSEFPFQKYRRRGFVNMTRLDSIPMRHRPTQRERVMQMLIDEQTAIRELLTEAAVAAAPGMANSSTAPPMSSRPPRFTQVKDYIVKIDVEGHEIDVMKGATSFLIGKRRPKMILSEVWRSLNITAYGDVMMSGAGYEAVMPFAGLYATTAAALSRYNSTLRRDMDTIIWVLPRWRSRLLPMFSDFEDIATAASISASDRIRGWTH